MISRVFISSDLDFCFMQETKISDDSVSCAFSSEWTVPSFWVPALGRSGVVAILCSESYASNVSVRQRDVSGRVLSLTVKFGTFKINLVNLYAPTVPSEKKTFFQVVPSFFFPSTWPLVGGDFNCYDSVFDKFGGAPSLDSVFKSLVVDSGMHGVSSIPGTNSLLSLMLI